MSSFATLQSLTFPTSVAITAIILEFLRSIDEAAFEAGWWALVVAGFLTVVTFMGGASALSGATAWVAAVAVAMVNAFLIAAAAVGIDVGAVADTFSSGIPGG